ncbi:vacuolar transporter chaperone [Entomortierella beljakovae]|nr:vacuolar transporter chaperone [Entomortierella beljakovae]
MQASRTLTPQPWHPDYQSSRSSTPNPLDLPEHRRRYSTDSEYNEFSEIDIGDRQTKKKTKSSKSRSSSINGNINNGNNNNNNNNNGQKPKRKSFFAKLSRTRAKKVSPGDGRVAGTGRLAQFSNERLYLHWIRFGIMQGIIATSLLNFGTNSVPAYIGVGAIIIALLTLVYSTTLFHLRHLYMVTKRPDVDYYVRFVPTLLCVALILLYGTNFVLTLSIGDAARSPSPYSEQVKIGGYF